MSKDTRTLADGVHSYANGFLVIAGLRDNKSRGGSVLKNLAAEIRLSFDINPLENHLVTDCLDTPTDFASSDLVVPFSRRHVSSQLIISSLIALLDSRLVNLNFLHLLLIVLCNITNGNILKSTDALQ